jgi:hypothetical protein
MQARRQAPAETGEPTPAKGGALSIERSTPWIRKKKPTQESDGSPFAATRPTCRVIDVPPSCEEKLTWGKRKDPTHSLAQPGSQRVHEGVTDARAPNRTLFAGGR